MNENDQDRQSDDKLKELEERLKRVRKTDDKEELRQLFRSLGLVTSLGATIVISMVLAYFFGAFLDQKFRTHPWMSVICLFGGVAFGGYTAYKLLGPYLK